METHAISFRWLHQNDPYYAQERELRFRVLREPLQMPKGSEKHTHEEDLWHLVGIQEERVIGCVLLLPSVDKKSGRLLQMAVVPSLQGQGVGAQLVANLEKRAREENFDEIRLHARAVAFPFYEKLGYQYVGDFFEEVGVPHRAMAKNLLHGSSSSSCAV